MRYIFVLLLLISLKVFPQCKTYILGAKGDTLDCVDKKDMKQGKWVIHHDEVRGEPGFEEEGEYKESRKEGVWRQYSLMGDLIGVEFYKWGNKDGVCKYYAPSGELLREESWKALNPDKQYDTLEIEDIDHLNQFKTVVVKNEGVAIKHGTWKYYEPSTGVVYKTETYEIGKLEIPAATAKNTTTDSTKSKVIPKEVLDYQKKNTGKKIKVRDGSVGN